MYKCTLHVCITCILYVQFYFREMFFVHYFIWGLGIGMFDSKFPILSTKRIDNQSCLSDLLYVCMCNTMFVFGHVEVIYMYMYNIATSTTKYI
jgi:hypothetical protein